jgi:HSP20 family protein
MVEHAVKEKEETRMTVPVVTRMEPVTPFFSLQRDMNKLIDDFSRELHMWSPQIREPFFGDFHAKIDLKENDKEIVVTAEIPGVEQKDIEIFATVDTLTVKGEKREETEVNEKNCYRTERKYGYFERVLPLPKEIDVNNIEATYKNGVVKIVMAKNPLPTKDTKKIAIK